MSVTTPLIGWCVLILLLEGILWQLFKRKFVQICVPSQGSDIFFHFFTVRRLWLLAILHTLSLIVSVVIAHLLLWP